jgi:hypothetical protein
VIKNKKTLEPILLVQKERNSELICTFMMTRVGVRDYETGYGVNEFDLLTTYTAHGTTRNYSAMANLHTL